MRPDRSAHRRVGYIIDAKLLTNFFDDFADGRIVYVANPGKKMMLDLKVQATEIPVRQFVSRREIGSGFHLVNRPFVFNGGGSGIRFGEGVTSTT